MHLFILVRPKQKKEGGGIWPDSDKYITLCMKYNIGSG